VTGPCSSHGTAEAVKEGRRERELSQEGNLRTRLPFGAGGVLALRGSFFRTEKWSQTSVAQTKPALHR
jgi:hypothetical protein